MDEAECRVDRRAVSCRDFRTTSLTLEEGDPALPTDEIRAVEWYLETTDYTP